MALRLQGGHVGGSSILFSLAIWNNSGVIYDSMSAAKAQSSQCFGQLLVLLVFFNDTHPTLWQAGSALEGYYQNVEKDLLPCDEMAVAVAA